VEECSRLLPGEVGLFVVDGEGYIKVYAEQEPEGDEAENFTDSEGIRHLQPVLVSCNTAYDPKVITSGTDFRIVGRVLNA
jgi:phage repressor protein C with HTH and peptisase S24 domain